MNDKDLAELESLVKMYKGHKKVADSQQLMITLWDKPTRTDSDNNILIKLLRIERQMAKTRKAKREVAKVLNAEKEKARKALTQGKIITGGALVAGATNGNNKEYYQKVMRKMLDDGLIGERDKAKYQQILSDLPKTPNQTQAPNGRPIR